MVESCVSCLLRFSFFLECWTAPVRISEAQKKPLLALFCPRPQRPPPSRAHFETQRLDSSGVYAGRLPATGRPPSHNPSADTMTAVCRFLTCCHCMTAVHFLTSCCRAVFRLKQKLVAKLRFNVGNSHTWQLVLGENIFIFEKEANILMHLMFVFCQELFLSVYQFTSFSSLKV